VAPQFAVGMQEAEVSGPAATAQQVMDDALMVPGQGPQLGRQGEGEQEVGGGHALLELALQPLLALVVLAMGAAAMAAGLGHQRLVVTIRAGSEHAGAERGAALFDGLKRFVSDTGFMTLLPHDSWWQVPARTAGVRLHFNAPGETVFLREAAPSNKGDRVRRLTAPALRCRSGWSPSRAAHRQRRLHFNAPGETVFLREAAPSNKKPQPTLDCSRPSLPLRLVAVTRGSSPTLAASNIH